MTLDLSDSGLLDMPPKAWATREKKIDKLDFIKMENFCDSNDSQEVYW